MRQSAEVAVVGAGPAGARAAELLAARGADVVLLDPKAPWEKPCGGGLTSTLFEDFPELDELRRLSRPIERARVELNPETGVDVTVDRPIWMISREALGRWQLRRALEAGARHERTRVSRIARDGRRWLLDAERGTLSASCLIGADGAASSVRSAVATGLKVELLPTRVAYPALRGVTPDTLVLRFYGDVVGYLWDFPRLDHSSVGIEAASGTRRRRALDARVDEYGASAGWEATGSLERAGAVIGTARLGHGDFSGVAGPGFALLGDAAGFADPFTGEGIRNAIRSAHLLAEAWDAGPQRWTTEYIGLARSTFAREFAAARLLRRMLSESGAGVHLLRWALTMDLAYAIVAGTLGAVSVHDLHVRRFLGRWLHAWRAIRAEPARRGVAVRSPVPREA